MEHNYRTRLKAQENMRKLESRLWEKKEDIAWCFLLQKKNTCKVLFGQIRLKAENVSLPGTQSAVLLLAFLQVSATPLSLPQEPVAEQAAEAHLLRVPQMERVQ